MSENAKNKKITIIVCVVFAAALVVLGSVYFFSRPKAEIGLKQITVTVESPQKDENYTINTAKEYLAEALADEGLITYEKSGMYTTVAGITADFGKDGAWWCLYVGGQMGNLGMNQQPIVNGETYLIKYTVN